MKIRKSVLYLGLVLFCFLFCTNLFGKGTDEQQVVSPPSVYSQDLEKISAIARYNRIPYYTEFGLDKYNVFTNMLTTGLDAQDDQELASCIREHDLASQRPYAQTFLLEQGIEDIDFLFQYLKYGYSGYGYFGGDAVFLPLKAEIVDSLQSTVGGDSDEKLTIQEYVSILLNALKTVVIDSHFSVARNSLVSSRRYCYLSKGLLFGEDETGYYVLPDDEVSEDSVVPPKKRQYVSRITTITAEELRTAGVEVDTVEKLLNGTPDNFMKPTLDRNGRLAYIICLTTCVDSDVIGGIQVDVKNNNDEVTSHIIRLRNIYQGSYWAELANRQVVHGYRNYRPYERNGVKIIELCSCTAPNSNATELEQFAQDATKLNDEDYLIIDLRNNGGGNNLYAQEWFRNFTGLDVPDGTLSSYLLSETIRTTMEHNELYLSIMASRYNHFCEQYTVPSWIPVGLPEAPVSQYPIANNTKIFVLMNSHIASAAEDFIQYLQLLDNVYLVGTNTEGCFMFGNVGRPIYLPNTGLDIDCGFSINVLPDFEHQDGQGFEPDLWVDSNDSLDLVLRLIENLKTQE